MAEKNNEMTFEQALMRLEEIVKNMESGEQVTISLSEAIERLSD